MGRWNTWNLLFNPKSYLQKKISLDFIYLLIFFKQNLNLKKSRFNWFQRNVSAKLFILLEILVFMNFWKKIISEYYSIFNRAICWKLFKPNKLYFMANASTKKKTACETSIFLQLQYQKFLFINIYIMFSFQKTRFYVYIR
jgi:hypothetical protein